MKSQAKWISSELGENIPLHLSRYFPRYKREEPATPEKTLLINHEIASRYLNYVYTGNTPTETGQDTICPGCSTIVTKRSGYLVRHLRIKEGKCTVCGKEIYKYFTSSF
jgi:pyruvate formate lyase activating enzyme